ncbi:hypothetical protein V1478_000969 [Vespula squamosa]|uniref:Uncharacterized protein n=1 Tax=Vespula squamosa TaxID=30214 RepID=A0ABD2C700_VESSQ
MAFERLPEEERLRHVVPIHLNREKIFPGLGNRNTYVDNVVMSLKPNVSKQSGNIPFVSRCIWVNALEYRFILYDENKEKDRDKMERSEEHDGRERTDLLQSQMGPLKTADRSTNSSIVIRPPTTRGVTNPTRYEDVHSYSKCTLHHVYIFWFKKF